MALRKIGKTYRTLIDFNGMNVNGFYVWGDNQARNADGTFKMLWGNSRPTVDPNLFNQTHITSPGLKGWNSLGCIVHWKKTVHTSGVDITSTGGVKLYVRSQHLGGYSGRMDWGMGGGHTPPTVLYKNTSGITESAATSVQSGIRAGMVVNDEGMGQYEFQGPGDVRSGNGLGSMHKVGLGLLVFLSTNVTTEEVFELTIVWYLGR